MRTQATKGVHAAVALALASGRAGAGAVALNKQQRREVARAAKREAGRAAEAGRSLEQRRPSVSLVDVTPESLKLALHCGRRSLGQRWP